MKVEARAETLTDAADGTSYRAIFARLHACCHRLETTWTSAYREGFEAGKYSRWVVNLEDSFFVWHLVFAVRIFTVAHQGAATSDDRASNDVQSLLRRLECCHVLHCLILSCQYMRIMAENLGYLVLQFRPLLRTWVLNAKKPFFLFRCTLLHFLFELFRRD